MDVMKSKCYCVVRFVAWRAKLSVTYTKFCLLLSEWWKAHGKLPPLEWFEEVYTLAVDSNHAEFKDRKDFIVLCFGSWLPKLPVVCSP